MRVGHSLIQLGRHREATACFARRDRARADMPMRISTGPGVVDLGDFDAGWSEYEWRFRTEGAQKEPRRSIYPQPLVGTARGGPLAQDHSSLHASRGSAIPSCSCATLQWCRVGATVHRRACCRRPKVAWPTRSAGVTRPSRRGALPSFDISGCAAAACLICSKTRLDTIPQRAVYSAARRPG